MGSNHNVFYKGRKKNVKKGSDCAWKHGQKRDMEWQETEGQGQENEHEPKTARRNIDFIHF